MDTIAAHTHTFFTPSQAAILTGVKTTLQLQWRNRGFVPSNPDGKHMRFTPAMICYLLVLKKLSDAGVGPADSYREAHDAALMILWHTLERVSDSWEGEDVSDAEAARAGTGHATLPRFFVWFPERGAYYGDDLNALFDTLDAVGKADSGAAVILDCKALGLSLGDRVDRLKLKLFTFTRESE